MTFDEFSEIRRDLRLTTGQIARILGVTRQTLHNWSRRGFPESLDDKLQALKTLHHSAAGDFETNDFSSLLADALGVDRDDPDRKFFRREPLWKNKFDDYCWQVAGQHKQAKAVAGALQIIADTGQSGFEPRKKIALALKLFLEAHGIDCHIVNAESLVQEMVDNKPIPVDSVVVGTPEQNPIAHLLWLASSGSEWEKMIVGDLISTYRETIEVFGESGTSSLLYTGHRSRVRASIVEFTEMLKTKLGRTGDQTTTKDEVASSKEQGN